MKKNILVVLTLLGGYFASAQNNSSLPYPALSSDGDPQKEDVTEVFLKVRQVQSEKFISFEYASHGAPWELEIRNANGILLLKRSPVTAENLLVNSAGFSTGTYLCTLYTRNSIITKKMILD